MRRRLLNLFGSDDNRRVTRSQSRRRQELQDQQRAEENVLAEQSRLDETGEQSERRAENAERMRRNRLDETEEESERRRTADAQQKQRSRSRETSVERRSRQAANRRQTAQHRQVVRAQSPEDEEHYLGEMDVICHHCCASFFEREVAGAPNNINQCCNFGKIELDVAHFADFPQRLEELFIADTPSARNFKANIRQFNSALALASMGAKIALPSGRGPYCFRVHGQVYHATGVGRDNRAPSYGQLYMLDTAEAARERTNNPANTQCSPQLMRQLGDFMADTNPNARAFKMMKEVEEEEERRAAAEGRTSDPVTLVFDPGCAKDRRRYNVPTANEVAVVYVGDEGDVPEQRQFFDCNRSGGLTNLKDTDPRVDPFTYPLFFPTGQEGWHKNLQKAPSERETARTRITQREYYTYLLQVRPGLFNPILQGKALFQQFAVDAFVKIEQNRLYYLRTHQTELRSDSYKSLQDFMAGEGDADMRGPPGKRIVLPSSFPGSPRAMVQEYQDAMAIVSKYGKPDYFLTMTCSPSWKEIVENLEPGQTATDRPDIVARVYHLKVKELFELLLHRHKLGEVAAYVSVFEWQKRGLPHTHTLLIMKPASKPRTAADVDRLIRAEIPDKDTEPRLWEIVTKNMMHRPCGTDNPSSPCMVDGECSKGFPKSNRDQTDISGFKYPEYRRRKDGRTVKCQGKDLDNRHVVPYNDFLCRYFNCHINLEVCALIQAVKYLFKYVYKGSDRAALRLQRQATGAQVIDEIKLHIDARYVCAPEAMHRIFGFELQRRSDTVYRLAVHLPNEQNVAFHPAGVAAAVRSAATKNTTLMAWFAINSESKETVERGNVSRSFVDSRQFRYLDMPDHYTFNHSSCQWMTRLRDTRAIGRMYTVSPHEAERYALRILLLAVKGALSFTDLRTVVDENGAVVVYPTFAEAAKALGLMADDSHFLLTLQEAAHFNMPAQLRATFVAIIAFCEVNDIVALWEAVKMDLSEDFAHHYTLQDAVVMAYYDVADRLERLGKEFDKMVAPPAMRPSVRPLIVFNPTQCRITGAQLYDTLNPRQKDACDTILTAVRSGRGGLFFIDGPGGSGKTYLYKTLFNMLVGSGKKVMCTAWTGIAATLLPGSRTAASLFKLNIHDNCKSSSLKRQHKDARELAEIDVFIWDEASMIPKNALQTVEETLRDMTGVSRLFGGSIFILGGDFRQVLPVVKRGSRGDAIEACIKSSPLWSTFTQLTLQTNMRVTTGDAVWTDFLLGVGNGTSNDKDFDDKVQLPQEVMGYGNIVEEVFGASIRAADIDSLAEMAILAPRNCDVNVLNDEVLRRMEETRGSTTPPMKPCVRTPQTSPTTPLRC